MKKLALLFFVLVAVQLMAQQSRTYKVNLRAQIYDSTGYCNCPEDGINNGAADCNSMGQVLISLYADTIFLKNYYTDETGYAPTINLPYDRYKLVFTYRSYKTAIVGLDFTTTDGTFTVVGNNASHVHYRAQGTDYFICVMMEGDRKKSGVKIVPKN